MSYRIRLSHVAAASLIALVLTALFTTKAASPVAPDSAAKIGVIDTEKILLTSASGKNALASLKKLQETAEAEVGRMQQEVKDLQTRINDGRPSLPQDQFAQLSKQLEDKVTALRRYQDNATRDLNKKRDDMLAEIDTKVMPVINQIGKEMGYTVIFRKFESGLIYADEAIDLTAMVIQRLDAPK
ncbi:MAG: OmpH family outer membrane protein [Acidobacteria bacterium]|nr:OmpH family outer membrane protein [Acidobacteriota bacterium]